MAWCMPAVAKHESFGYGGRVTSYHPFVWVRDGNVIYNQFRAGGGHRSENPTLRVQGEEGIPLWCRAGSETGAGGYGILQVTGNSSSGKYYAIPRGQIWNWQDNVKAGLAILKAKYDEASSRFNDQFDDQESAVGIRSLPTYRVKHESPNTGASYDFTFTQDGDRKMLHLCVLKQYNGASKYEITKTQAETRDANKGVVREGNFVLCPAGSGYYCAWLDSYNKNGYNFTNQWVVGPYASNGNDYVDLVLSMVNFNNNEN